MTLLLITRPRPSGDRTAAAARALGLRTAIAPLMTVRPVAWRAPDDMFDALLFTSSTAVALAGPMPDRWAELPAYAVGAATAAAVRAVRGGDATAGSAGVEAILRQAAADGRRHLLHLAGADRIEAAPPPGMRVTVAVVYRADPVDAFEAGIAPRLAKGDMAAALFSPRSAAHFAALVDAGCIDRGGLDIVALSPAVAAAAGAGWRRVAVAARPSERSLLAAALGLCQKAR